MTYQRDKLIRGESDLGSKALTPTMLQHMGVPYEILPDYAEGHTNRLALALQTQALPSKDIESHYEWNYLTGCVSVQALSK